MGGLTATGDLVGVLDYRDVSAYSYGVTTIASCPFGGYCKPTSYLESQGGTSAATATAAGIAGLVRAYHKTETAGQIRNRLIASGVGSYKQLDAKGAIEYSAPPPPPPFTASITGATYVQPGATCTWLAGVSGGTSPFTYQWYRDGTLVSTSSDYTGSAAAVSFELYLRVQDATGALATDQVTVYTDSAAEFCLL